MSPLRTDETAGVLQPNSLTAQVDHLSLAAATVTGPLQVDVTLNAEGTIIVTVAGLNEVNAPFSTQFTITITAAPANPTDHFSITEVGQQGHA